MLMITLDFGNFFSKVDLNLKQKSLSLVMLLANTIMLSVIMLSDPREQSLHISEDKIGPITLLFIPLAIWSYRFTFFYGTNTWLLFMNYFLMFMISLFFYFGVI